MPRLGVKAKRLTMCTYGEPHEVAAWCTPFGRGDVGMNREWAPVMKTSRHKDPTHRQKWCPGSLLEVHENTTWPGPGA